MCWLSPVLGVTFFENCIENNEIVDIGYVDRSENFSEREIEPHTLILKQGLWYVYAYCLKRNEFRLFRIGRISKAKSTGKNFTRRPTENLKNTLNDWYENLSTETIELLVDKKAKADIEEWLGVDKVSTLSDGSIRAVFNLPIDKTLVGKLLSFGNDVKILAPYALIKEVKTATKKVLELYK